MSKSSIFENGGYEKMISILGLPEKDEDILSGEPYDFLSSWNFGKNKEDFEFSIDLTSLVK